MGVLAGLVLSGLLPLESDVVNNRHTKRPRRRLLETGNATRALLARPCLGPGSHWQSATQVERLTALREVNADVPASTQTGPKGALLLSPANVEPSSTGGIPAACEDVTVVVVHSSPGRCLVLSEAARPTYRVARRERAESAWQPLSRIREARQRMPTDSIRKRSRTLAHRLLAKLGDVSAELEPILARAARHVDPAYEAASKGAVLAMCINTGNLDLLLNFVLSVRCGAVDGVDIRNLVVFAADDTVANALREASIAHFRHSALGDFREEAARSYGDFQFVEMMWLKITCVFLVNHLGYDVLFQDADLVWWKSPWRFFARRPDLDTFWMDDGARTSRFAPHFPNTGFYLIRANPRTQLFNRHLLGTYSSVIAWQSHQAVVSQLLAEAHALYGLSVHILDKEAFPSGKQLHHNRPLFDRIHAKSFTPYCFHMCWTAGKADKLKFLKQENLWFLADSCPLRRMLERPHTIPHCATTCPAAENSGERPDEGSN